MHDIKAIRADPAAFANGLERRGVVTAVQTLLNLDREQRHWDQTWEKQTAERSLLGAEVARLNASLSGVQHEIIRDQINQQIIDVREDSFRFKLKLETAKGKADDYARQRLDTLVALPNLPAPDVPDGLDETGNVVVDTRGTIPSFDFAPREHDTLAMRFGYDPEAAAAMAGARFAVLKGPLARLHRALGQFMIDRHVAANGYTEVAPPLLVLEKAVFGAGQLPKFADDLFRTTDGRYLISTAEVSLTNLVRERVLDAADLPLRFTALTPCFRSEAGSAGRDTRGLIRQHQFDKVELVSIVADAAAAAAEHEAMTACAEGVLDALGLPYRRMLLCAGDMGFAARKTYDLEVWLPGQGAYREISSCSDCGDFQARRIDARFKAKGTKGTAFVHTLNGSALAVGRALVAVIETYQRADGSVAVPEVLLPYMGGVSELMPG